MTKYIFKNPTFIKTATKPKDYPVLRNLSGHILPEVAVAGRSNVGKSSLLNNLFQSKGLVKTSATPGKTQAINFFTLNDQMAFADLPGYGYAKVPLEVRKQWGPMIQTYLQKRESLRVILFLFDIRRRPNDEDRNLLEWIAQNQKAMILVLTKIDKVSQNEKKANAQSIIDSFGAENIQYVCYSSTKNIGRLELTKMLSEAITEEQREEVRSQKPEVRRV